MDAEALIKWHNEELEAAVDRNPGLKYRLLDRARAPKRMRRPTSLKIGKYALAYSLAFLLALFLQSLIMETIREQSTTAQPGYIVDTDPFQADFSGSVYPAYLEVIQWEN